MKGNGLTQVSVVIARRTFFGSDLEDCIRNFEAWRDETGVGASEIGSRWPVQSNGNEIGHLSYNGRFWPAEGKALEVIAVMGNRDRIAVDKYGNWKQYLKKIPPGHQAMGVVQVGSEEPGALVRVVDTDVFVQLSDAGMRTLDQRKVRAALGVSQPVGAVVKGYERRELFSVRLEPGLAEYARQLGGDNLSEGINQVLRERMEREKREG